MGQPKRPLIPFRPFHVQIQSTLQDHLKTAEVMCGARAMYYFITNGKNPGPEERNPDLKHHVRTWQGPDAP